jgi:hypothetical protein
MTDIGDTDVDFWNTAASRYRPPLPPPPAVSRRSICSRRRGEGLQRLFWWRLQCSATTGHGVQRHQEQVTRG